MYAPNVPVHFLSQVNLEYEWKEGRLGIGASTHALFLCGFLSEVSHSPSSSNDPPRDLLADDKSSIISTLETMPLCFLSQDFLLYTFGCYISYDIYRFSPSQFFSLSYCNILIKEIGWFVL